MEGPACVYLKANPSVVTLPSAKPFLVSVWQSRLAYDGVLKKYVLGVVYGDISGALY